MEEFKVIIVEDVQLELKGTEHIFKSEIPEATIIGTAQNESELWKLMRQGVPDMILLDLGRSPLELAQATGLRLMPSLIFSI